MSWGIFKKIGQGIKKGFNWVKDHIIKPIGKVAAPIAKVAAPVIKTILPESAPFVDVAEGVIDKLSGSGSGGPSANGGLVGANGHGIRVPVDDGDWARAFDNSKVLNRKIQLK